MMLTMRRSILTITALAALALVACGSGGADESFASPATAPAAEAAMGAPQFDSLAQSEEEFARVEKSSADGAFSSATAVQPGAVAPRPAAAVGANSRGTGEPALPSEPFAELVVQTRIIVRTVDMTIVVADVGGSLDLISDMATEMGGWVVSSDRRQKHRASISIRVPAEQLDAAIGRLRDAAVDVEAEVINSRDVTDEYVDTTSRLKTLRATEEALLKLMERAETVEEALKVRDSLTSVQQDVESLEGRIKFLEQTAAFSLVNVTLDLESAELSVDAGEDQTGGVGHIVRFRAFFKPPEGMEDHRFTWDFGDGSPTFTSDRTAPTESEDTRVTATVAHAYRDERDSPFIARVEITSTGEAGVAEGDDTIMVVVTEIPVIEVFAGELIVVEEGEEVEFNGSFTRPKGLTDVRFRWDFGDGATSTTRDLGEGDTRAIAIHTYSDHRPFDYRATLTITAESDAGKIEASNSVSVRVTEAEGWTVAGWSFGDQGKDAVRTLSRLGQGAGTGLIWLLIFSPVVVIAGFAVWVPGRRFWRRRRR